MAVKQTIERRFRTLQTPVQPNLPLAPGFYPSSRNGSFKEGRPCTDLILVYQNLFASRFDENLNHVRVFGPV